MHIGKVIAPMNLLKKNKIALIDSETLKKTLRKMTKNSILAFLSIVLLAACGGGGGGGGSSPTPAPVPTPAPAPTYDTSIFGINSPTEFVGVVYHRGKLADPESGSRYYDCLYEVKATIEKYDDDEFFISSWAFGYVMYLNPYPANQGNQYPEPWFDHTQGYSTELLTDTTNTLSQDNYIDLYEADFNPYGSSFGDSISDIEDMSANFKLTFPYSEYGDGTGTEADYCHNNLRLSVIASPESQSGANDASFMGGDGGNTFLYLVDKRFADNYSDNIVSSGDAIGIWSYFKSIFSFQSKPTIDTEQVNIDVKTDSGYEPRGYDSGSGYTSGHAGLTENSYDIDFLNNDGEQISGDGFIKFITPQQDLDGNTAYPRVFFGGFLERCLFCSSPERMVDKPLWFMEPEKEVMYGISQDNLDIKLAFKNE